MNQGRLLYSFESDTRLLNLFSRFLDLNVHK